MRYLAALIFLIISFQPASSACISVDLVKSRIAKNLPGSQIILASGDVVAEYMRLYNSYPPPSRLPAPDQLIFAKSTRLQKVVVITGFVKGCRIGGFFAGRKLHRFILNKITIDKIVKKVGRVI